MIAERSDLLDLRNKRNYDSWKVGFVRSPLWVRSSWWPISVNKASTTDFFLQKYTSHDVFSNAPRIPPQKRTAYRARSICFFGLIFTILHRFVFQLKKTFFSVAIFIFIHSVQAQIQSKKRNSLQNNNLQSQRSKMKQMLISYFISSPLHQYPSFHHYLKHQTHLQICSEPVFWLCKIIRILESFFRNATC